MARAKKISRNGTALAEETGEAELLEETADRKLAAAKKLAQADAILSSRGEDDPEETDEAPTEPEPQPTLISEPAQPESKLDRILKTLNGEGKIEVFKMTAGTPCKVGTYQLDDYPDIMESIARKHGGGDYRIRFKNPRGEYVGQDTQSFDPDAYAKPGAALAAPAGGDLMAQLLAQMQAREDRLMSKIDSQQAQMNALLLEIVKAGQQGGGHTRSAEEMLALMKMAKEMGGEKESPLGAVRDIIEAVSMLQGAGVTEAPNPINLAIDKAFQLIGPLLGAWAAKQAGATGPTPARPAALPAPAPNPALPRAQEAALPAPAPSSPIPASTPAAAPVATPDPRLKGYAASLLQAASAGASPDRTADMVLAAISDDEVDALHAMVDDPAFVGQMLAAEPALVPHQAWLVSLCKAIKDGLQPADEPVPATAEPTVETAPAALSPNPEVPA